MKKLASAMLFSYYTMRILFRLGGKDMEYFMKMLVDNYGKFFAVFVAASVVVGCAVEFGKNIIFSALDKKYPDSEKIATAKRVFSLVFALFLTVWATSAIIQCFGFPKVMIAQMFIGFVMFLIQMVFDLNVVKKVFAYFANKTKDGKKIKRVKHVTWEEIEV